MFFNTSFFVIMVGKRLLDALPKHFRQDIIHQWLPAAANRSLLQFCRRNPASHHQQYALLLVYLIVAMVLLSLSTTFYTAQAQTTVIKVNLAGLLQKSIGAAVEVKLSDQFTIDASGAIVSQTTGIEGDTNTVYSKESGFLVGPELRYYFGGNYADAPSGFFLGADLLYEGVKLSYTTTPDSLGNAISTSGNGKNLGIGIILGSQWIFNDRFAVELFFNPYYNFPSTSGDIAVNPVSDAFIRNYTSEKSGFLFKRIGLSVGIAFWNDSIPALLPIAVKLNGWWRASI